MTFSEVYSSVEVHIDSAGACRCAEPQERGEPTAGQRAHVEDGDRPVPRDRLDDHPDALRDDCRQTRTRTLLHRTFYINILFITR